MSAEIEATAKVIYAGMKWAAERAESGKPPEWVDGGNSDAQTEARRLAWYIVPTAADVAKAVEQARRYEPPCECDTPVIVNGTANLCARCGRQDTNYVGQVPRRGT